MTMERIKMPFGNWSDLDKSPKVSVALNTERRDKVRPSIRCQTIKPLTCLWDFEGTVLLTSHSCIFSTGSMAAFSLSLLLETHPMKQQQETKEKARTELMLLHGRVVETLRWCSWEWKWSKAPWGSWSGWASWKHCCHWPGVMSTALMAEGLSWPRHPCFLPCIGCFSHFYWGSSGMAMVKHIAS